MKASQTHGGQEPLPVTVSAAPLLSAGAASASAPEDATNLRGLSIDIMVEEGPIGIRFKNISEHGCVVISPVTAQAEAQGVKVGDRIAFVAGEEMSVSMTQSEVVELIKRASRPLRIVFQRVPCPAIQQRESLQIPVQPPVLVSKHFKLALHTGETMRSDYLAGPFESGGADDVGTLHCDVQLVSSIHSQDEHISRFLELQPSPPGAAAWDSNVLREEHAAALEHATLRLAHAEPHALVAHLFPVLRQLLMLMCCGAGDWGEESSVFNVVAEQQGSMRCSAFAAMLHVFDQVVSVSGDLPNPHQWLEQFVDHVFDDRTAAWSGESRSGSEQSASIIARWWPWVHEACMAVWRSLMIASTPTASGLAAYQGWVRCYTVPSFKDTPIRAMKYTGLLGRLMHRSLLMEQSEANVALLAPLSETVVEVLCGIVRLATLQVAIISGLPAQKEWTHDLWQGVKLTGFASADELTVDCGDDIAPVAQHARFDTLHQKLVEQDYACSGVNDDIILLICALSNAASQCQFAQLVTAYFQSLRAVHRTRALCASAAQQSASAYEYDCMQDSALFEFKLAAIRTLSTVTNFVQLNSNPSRKLPGAVPCLPGPKGDSVRGATDRLELLNSNRPLTLMPGLWLHGTKHLLNMF